MRRSRPYRDQRYQGRFSERKYLERVRKPRTYQEGNTLMMEEWEEENNPHIKKDLVTLLPVFDVHSNTNSPNLSINKGRGVLRRIIELCIDEGAKMFFVIHGTGNGRRTWLDFLKRLFGDAMKIAWRKNKGVSVVYLHKLPPFKLYELMYLSLAA